MTRFTSSTPETGRYAKCDSKTDSTSGNCPGDLPLLGCRMADDDNKLTPAEVAAARKRRLEMQHLQIIEGNPLDADDIAMFEMFEREGWSHERCRAYIIEQARASKKLDK